MHFQTISQLDYYNTHLDQGYTFSIHALYPLYNWIVFGLYLI